MTFSEFQRILAAEQEQQQGSPEMQELIKRCKGAPFYHWYVHNRPKCAVAEEYNLKKDDTSYNDILDAFRLSLQYYKRGK